jgi:biopolymer transport protein ExbB/TolQ
MDTTCWVLLGASYLVHIVVLVILYSLLRRPEQRYRDVKTSVEQLELAHEELFDKVKSMHGRKAQQARRDQDEERSSGFHQRKGETPAQWKARVRKELNTGKLKPPSAQMDLED